MFPEAALVLRQFGLMPEGEVRALCDGLVWGFCAPVEPFSPAPTR